ncbi:hypothetical protein MTO96_035902, partial [Rhipicephalus appendiculatus]
MAKTEQPKDIWRGKLVLDVYTFAFLATMECPSPQDCMHGGVQNELQLEEKVEREDRDS